MQYVDEFRDSERVKAILEQIATEARTSREYHLMEFCGSHTYSISKYGLASFLPSNIRMIHGPGCPVCVLPMGRIDGAIELAKNPKVILTTYGDIMRVPASNRTHLLQARAEGADIRMVYSCMDSLKIARENPDREVVFFAIGFETTTPPTVSSILEAEKAGLSNYSVYCNHVLTPPAVAHTLESPELRQLGTFRLDGFLGPAHVSAIIGSRPFEYFAYEYNRPVVVSGFEPVDVLQGILMLIRQLNSGRAEVENQYSRAVTRDGNLIAQKWVAEVLELRPFFEWRGLGKVPYSGLRLKEKYSRFDAEKKFDLKTKSVPDHKACLCGSILRGLQRPTDCKLFGKSCTPEHPQGPCMVSSEGTCGAHYRYRLQPLSTS